MSPEQKIRWAILLKAAELNRNPAPDVTHENVDQLYDQLVEKGGCWDAKNEVRWGDVETALPCPYSRHYESKSVATKMPDGSWVGWVRWFGGGKYGEPESIDWMKDAYDLTCEEEEKVLVVRTFSRQERAAEEGPA